MPGAGLHAGQPVGARAPQEVEQDRLGLVVHGVTGRHASGSTAKRAARARASRFGPARDRHLLGHEDARPRSAAARATTSASAADPSRSPWSTWIAVTRTAGRGSQDEQGQGVRAARHGTVERRTRRRESYSGAGDR